MNAVLLSILGLLALSSHALAIVCQANACDTVRCAAVTEENCDGKVVPNGGYCGCCDACRSILKEGESCFALLIQGPTPPSVICDDGLVCNFNTRQCEKATQ
jgi:hypothetical protein